MYTVSALNFLISVKITFQIFRRICKISSFVYFILQSFIQQKCINAYNVIDCCSHMGHNVEQKKYSPCHGFMFQWRKHRIEANSGRWKKLNIGPQLEKTHRYFHELNGQQCNRTIVKLGILYWVILLNDLIDLRKFRFYTNYRVNDRLINFLELVFSLLNRAQFESHRVDKKRFRRLAESHTMVLGEPGPADDREVSQYLVFRILPCLFQQRAASQHTNPKIRHLATNSVVCSGLAILGENKFHFSQWRWDSVIP